MPDDNGRIKKIFSTTGNCQVKGEFALLNFDIEARKRGKIAMGFS